MIKNSFLLLKKSLFFIRNNKLKTLFLVVTFCYLLICQSCMKFRTNSKETKSFFTSQKIKYLDSLIKIDDHTVHYIETGKKNAPTLIFVHGSPGSWDNFKDYLKDTLLLSKYRMISVDRPGFGYSDFGKAENLNTQAHILEKFIAKVATKTSIYLIGHSMGGPVIVQMAANKPELYKGLIILAGAVDPHAETPENWRAIIKTKPIRYLIPGALRPSNDELWWLKEDLFILEKKLKNITSKVILIHGTKDQLVPFSNVAFMKREFSNIQSLKVIAIENANHFIPWEHYKTIRNTLYNLEK